MAQQDWVFDFIGMKAKNAIATKGSNKAMEKKSLRSIGSTPQQEEGRDHDGQKDETGITMRLTALQTAQQQGEGFGQPAKGVKNADENILEQQAHDP